jgi:hypothetical protein
MEYEYHYSRYPALRAYIDRVGAEQINFRRFMVKEFHGSHYYVEKVLIKILDDFSIECRSPEYAPSELEAAQIQAELSKEEFPRSIRASVAQVQELLDSGMITGNLYTFYDQKVTREGKELVRKEVIMCQERRETDGGKVYIPWCLFMAKGGSPTWRQMEPDGALPFWKPKVKRNKASIMVHEGAKTAHFIDALVNDPERREERKKHPWIDQLTQFEHWGAIGGALAIHRCDYQELRREQLQGNLYYVSDNDHVGKEAAKTFSRMWGGVLYNVKFDNKFRPGWDLADPIPETLISKTGSVELTLLDYTFPATWATRRMEKAGQPGRPGYTLTKAFAEEWVHTVTPNFFCHVRMTNYSFDKQGEFDSFVRPFSDIDDTGRLLKANWANKGVSVKYDPGRAPGFFSGKDKRSYLNLYIPSWVRDYTPAEAKGVGRLYEPFVDFLQRLFPNEYERGEVSKWAATLLACPGVKMNYGLLLISEMQGVGKTTFSDIIGEILGEPNVASTSESSILSQFTPWAQRQLVVVNEIYQGHSTAAYNRLKEVITDKTLRVERKFVSEYYVDNHVHIIACSNSLRALKLDNTDRRWFVPQVSAVKQPHQYWKELHDWLENEDGYRKVKQWAKYYVAEHGRVESGAEAPWTPTKKEMMEESDSAGQELIRNNLRWCKQVSEMNGSGEEEVDRAQSPEAHKLISAVKEGLPLVMFDSDGVRAITEVLYNGKANDRIEKLMHIRRIAEQEGLHVGKARITHPASGYKRMLGARVISTSQELALRDPNELTCAGMDAKDMCLVDLARLAQELRFM